MTIEENDVTIPVSHICMTDQLWWCHRVKRPSRVKIIAISTHKCQKIIIHASQYIILYFLNEVVYILIQLLLNFVTCDFPAMNGISFEIYVQYFASWLHDNTHHQSGYEMVYWGHLTATLHAKVSNIAGSNHDMHLLQSWQINCNMKGIDVWSNIIIPDSSSEW